MPSPTLYSPYSALMLLRALYPYSSTAAQAEIEESYPALSKAGAFKRLISEVEGFSEDFGLFTRFPLPEKALLDGFLNSHSHSLPVDNVEAQESLDSWVKVATMDLLKEAPVRVEDKTSLVAMHSLAVKNFWANYTTKNFRSDEEKSGFLHSGVLQTSTISPTTSRTVLATNEGLLFTLVRDDENDPMELLSQKSGWEFLNSPSEISKHPHSIKVQSLAEVRCYALAPEFKAEATVDLGEDAGRFGVEALLRDGLPGLTQEAKEVELKQGSTLHVTKDGIEAAAVTAMSLEKSAPTASTFFVGDFTTGNVAYSLTHPAVSTPLFLGRLF